MNSLKFAQFFANLTRSTQICTSYIECSILFYSLLFYRHLKKRYFVAFLDENSEREQLRDDRRTFGVSWNRQRKRFGGDAHHPRYDGSTKDLSQKGILRKGKVMKQKINN